MLLNNKQDLKLKYLDSLEEHLIQYLENIKKGEIIIATRVGLGKVCKLAQDTAINQDLKGIIPKKYDIIRDFIFYFFKSRAKFIEENGVGATVKGVKIKFVENLLLMAKKKAEKTLFYILIIIYQK